MTPVKQSKLYLPDGIHNGNCFAACVASLLDLPLWMVPPFEEMFGRGGWQRRCQEWLAQMFQKKLVRVEGHPWEQLPEYYIASGLSPRDVMHAVIFHRGDLAHDPHYSNAGIATVEYCEYLQPIAELQTSTN